MNEQHIRIWHAATTICLYSTGIFAQPINDSILGQWYTEGCKAVFDFYRCDQEYKARLIPLKKPDMLDSNNPIDSLKKRRLNGATTVYGLEYDFKKKRWVNGKVYNPQNGKTYSCYCSLAAGGTQLLFRGYLGVSLLGGSQIWKREECKK